MQRLGVVLVLLVLLTGCLGRVDTSDVRALVDQRLANVEKAVRNQDWETFAQQMIFHHGRMYNWRIINEDGEEELDEDGRPIGAFRSKDELIAYVRDTWKAKEFSFTVAEYTIGYGKIEARVEGLFVLTTMDGEVRRASFTAAFLKNSPGYPEWSISAMGFDFSRGG